MLAKEVNEKMCQTGADTPMGKLLRYYWYPIAGSVELDENPVKKVRLLGEDLVLYRDRSGNLGLIDEPCPHRRVSLEYGIPEQEGLRCPYHGWLFNHEGKCIEQPAEPWDSTFKDRVTTKAYPVQELGGLIFAYLGPQPAPLLPRYDLLVQENVIRHIAKIELPCNWIQCQENALDPAHAEWLHGRYMDYVWERKGVPGNSPLRRRHKKLGFDRYEHGLIKRRVVEGGTEEDDGWKIGHAIVFPHMLRVGTAMADPHFQYLVPIDDTHTLHITYQTYRPGIAVPPQSSVPVFEVPLLDDDGRFISDVIRSQDFMVFATQGPMARRDLEHLGQSDAGVIMLRELLIEQMEKVERGEEPIEIYRDPAKNQFIAIPQERVLFRAPGQSRLPQRERDYSKWSPIRDTVEQLFAEADERSARGEKLIPFPEPPVYPPALEEKGHHREVSLLP